MNNSSGGRLFLKIYPSGAIVPSTKEFDGIDGGLLEGGSGAVNFWKDKFHSSTLFTYQVDGLTAFEAMIWWDIGGGKELLHRMIKDYDVMAFRGLITTPEVFLESAKSLETLKDFKGLKVRASGDAAEVMARMGASPISMPVGEIYESMRRKVIDACEISCPSMDWSSAIYEVAKYLYLSPVRQPSHWGAILLRESAFQALPDDLKGVVIARNKSNISRKGGKK